MTPPETRTEWADIDIFPCWHADGWECAAEWSMRDARVVTRAEALGTVGDEVGVWTDARAWKRYIRPFSVEEQWAEARRLFDYPEEGPPAGWHGQEDVPCWEFVPRSHPDALPVWVCGIAGDTPPPSPAQARATTVQGGDDGE